MARMLLPVAATTVLCVAVAAVTAIQTTKGSGPASPAPTTQMEHVPGLQFVGNGVNLVTMQLGLGPIIDNEFSPSLTWTNNVTKKTYLVPTQMIPYSLAFSNYSNATVTYQGLQDMQLTREEHYHWHSGFLGMDSHSKTTYRYLHEYYQHSSSLSESSLVMEFLQLTAPVLSFAPLKTTFTFQQAWKFLPDTCCSNEAEFKLFEDFFAYAGHAFMDSAKLGGKVRGHTWFNRCFFHKKSVHWVNEQSGWSFLGIIGAGHSSHSSESKLNHHFTDCATSNVSYEGGDPTKYNTDDWTAWAKTIFDQPHPVSFTLKPIHELITNSTKAAVVQQAMLESLKRAQAALNATETAMAANATHHPEPSCCKLV